MNNDPAERRLTRRGLLHLGGVGLAAGALGAPVLTSCSKKSGAQAADSAAKVPIPAYVPFTGPSADLAGTKTGVLPGFYAYPKNPVRSVTSALAHGGTTSVMLITFTPPPAAEADNADLQAIEKRLGTKLTLNLVAPADYQAKFSTVMAGNDLPDLFLYTYNKPVPHLPEFLAAKCADLTPHLAGGAVKAWPNLANIPTKIWQNSAVNGKIYGVPVPVPLAGSGFFYYADMLDESRAALPKNSDDFLALLKEMTNPKAGRWGFVGPGGVFAMSVCQSMWHVPNNWAVDGSGHFTKDIETTQNKDALAFNRKLYQAGVFYPGMQGFSNPKRKEVFNAGKAFMTADGFTAMNGYWHSTVRPHAKIRAMIPPGHNGGQGRLIQTTGYYSITLVKKADARRIKELLGVMNFFAAPFGTQEYLLCHYGADGVDYTRDARGNPVQTSRGRGDLPTSDNPWPYFIAGGPGAFYDPDSRDYVDVAHQAMTDALPVSEPDPTLGLYSATDATKGATIAQTVTDALTDVVSGRRPMSDYDKIVRDWRSQGGDEIRTEYQQAWKQAHH